MWGTTGARLSYIYAENLKKVYVPPEVYVPQQDHPGLADINAMYVEQFNLFLHYKQEKRCRILLKINVQMDSSSLIALCMTKVNFLYIFLHVTLDSQTKVVQTWFYLLCTVRMSISITKWFIFLFWWLFWFRAGWYSFTLNHSHTQSVRTPHGGI